MFRQAFSVKKRSGDLLRPPDLHNFRFVFIFRIGMEVFTNHHSDFFDMPANGHNEEHRSFCEIYVYLY